MRGRERERQRRKGLVKSCIQTCVVYFSFALCCSLCLCLSFLFSLCLCCVCICSLFLYLPLFFFFLFLHPFFFWIMADQLSFGSLFFSFQSFLIGNGRLGGFLASRGLPLYIYIKYFLVSPYYLVHNSVTSICIAVQVYVPITLFMAHFFYFQQL